jgi:hypothetical protein
MAKVSAVSGMLPVYSVRDVPGPYRCERPTHPRHFAKRVCKLLKTNEARAKKRAKREKESARV